MVLKLSVMLPLLTFRSPNATVCVIICAMMFGQKYWLCVEMVEKYGRLVREFTKFSCEQSERKEFSSFCCGSYRLIIIPKKCQYIGSIDELLRPDPASQITVRHGAVLCCASIGHSSL